MQISRLFLLIVSGYGPCAMSAPPAVEVSEFERRNLWVLENPTLPPRFGTVLKPGFSAIIVMKYTVQEDGSVTGVEVGTSTDSSIPLDLLAELVSHHTYVPTDANMNRTPVRTEMTFTFGPAPDTTAQGCKLPKCNSQ